ncbi:MAG: lysylphosphatidylglycerol synthetase family protein, partial [Planctomycetales bacterium]|nr:lysylphosphatidylglycerol synthetase family protein [Planctomycetales bacterium]
MLSRVARRFGPLLALLLLLTALFLLHSELKQFHWNDFREGLHDIRPAQLVLAVCLTIANYLSLTIYDMLGLRYVGERVKLAQAAFGSFIAFAVGNSFGTLLSGSTVRYRLYSAAGISLNSIVRLVVFINVSFWIGVAALAGLTFLTSPIDVPRSLHLPLHSTRPLGLIFAGIAISYLAICARKRRVISVRSWDFTPPDIRLSLLQLFVSTIDLLLACGVLYVLLPDSVSLPYWQFLTVYLLALVTSVISQVPGGVGVFEIIMLALLQPTEPPAVVGALLAFRLIYYLVPLSTGVVLLGVSELLAHHHTARRAFASLRTWTAPIAPRVMAFSVFLAGVILLFSGATPPAAGRTELLRRAMPLPVIELSHFAGSVIGMLLLILARSLQRRVESAYYLTIALLVGGVITSILKGFDWEEATILATMLAVFLPCRQHFYRKGAMLTERFTPRWMMAIIGVLACTVWLMLFAFKHVEYQHDLWWKFEIAHDAPRSLRGVAGAAVVALAAFSLRVMRARGKLGAMPDQQDFEIARSI